MVFMVMCACNGCVRVWQTVINNVCNVLPTDWSTTHARDLLQSSLNISAVKVSGMIYCCDDVNRVIVMVTV